MKELFPAKNTEDSLEKELECCHALIWVIKGKDDLEHLKTSRDADAKTGHKTADTAFFGYKTHIAMSGERIITAATVTSGEKTAKKKLRSVIR